MEVSFSEPYAHTSSLCEFSPDGRYLASCCQCRLSIRDSGTQQVLSMHTALDPIQGVEWSPDSSLVLCALYRRGVVQVWSLEQSEWSCKIDEGLCGLVSALWTPDSRHILTTCAFHLRITVWSLLTKSVSYLKWPKLEKGSVSFSKNGKFMSLAERRDGKDHVSVFNLSSWVMLSHFPVATEDLSAISFSPDCSHLCVIDSPIFCRVAVYSVDGRCLAEVCPYPYALGLRCIDWSHSGQLLAVGAYDQNIRVLNHLTWSVLAEFSHISTVEQKGTAVFVETEAKPSFARETHKRVVCRYEARELPYPVPTRKPNPKEPDPKMGVCSLKFSCDSSLLASKNENMPNTVWIWSLKKVRLTAVLSHLNEVRCFAWDPCRPRLAICTGSHKIYIWSLAASGAVIADLPALNTFSVRHLRWHPNGVSLLVCSNTHFYLCYLDDTLTE